MKKRIVKGCSLFTKVINNSNIEIELPHPGYDAWVDNSNPQYEIKSIKKGTAVLRILVRFMNGNSIYSTQTVTSGSPLKRPTDPTTTNLAFDGWYTAKTGGEKWVFTNSVKSGMNLHARFKNKYTVSYLYGNTALIYAWAVWDSVTQQEGSTAGR